MGRRGEACCRERHGGLRWWPCQPRQRPGGAPLHEPLALGVAQDAALAARPLCDQAARAIDACGWASGRGGHVGWSRSGARQGRGRPCECGASCVADTRQGAGQAEGTESQLWARRCGRPGPGQRRWAGPAKTSRGQAALAEGAPINGPIEEPRARVLVASLPASAASPILAPGGTAPCPALWRRQPARPTCGVELHKLEVLQRQPRARRHGAAVAGAGVRRGGGEVGAAVAASGQDGLVRAEAVQGAVLHAQRNDAAARAVLRGAGVRCSR